MRKAGARLKVTPRSLQTGLFAVSGKLGQRTDNGFEVVDAGVQIFEKKPKDTKPEVSIAASDTSPSL